MYARAILLVASSVLAVSSLPVQAVVVNYQFPLTVQQEVPAPTIPGLQPAGVGIVAFDTTSNLLSWTIYYAGLSGPIVAPGAHFHGPAAIGATAGVQVTIAGGASPVLLPQPASGVLTGSATLSAAQETDLLGGLWYVNLHTALNQAGELRGQVIPEPATLALLAAGGLLLRRRRR